MLGDFLDEENQIHRISRKELWGIEKEIIKRKNLKVVEIQKEKTLGKGESTENDKNILSM